MQQLTYADRERLLGNLDILVERWNGTDEDLQALARRWAETTHPTYGYERAMSRDVLQLSRYLQLYATEADIAHISRGALLHVVGNTVAESNSTNAFGQLRGAFVCRYAVHEIRSRLGEEATFSLPRLTAEERSSAESLFLDLVAEHAIPDPELLRRVDGLADQDTQHSELVVSQFDQTRTPKIAKNPLSGAISLLSQTSCWDLGTPSGRLSAT